MNEREVRRREGKATTQNMFTTVLVKCENKRQFPSNFYLLLVRQPNPLSKRCPSNSLSNIYTVIYLANAIVIQRRSLSTIPCVHTLVCLRKKGLAASHDEHLPLQMEDRRGKRLVVE